MEDGVTDVEGIVGPLEREEENDDDDDEGGGGLINNLISTRITPLNDEDVSKSESESESGGVVDNIGGERGVISNQGDVGEKKEKEEIEEEEDDGIVDEKIKRLKTEDGGEGEGGGFIHNIVSHLPTSIPDDAVPTADEATILINSLVRD